MPTKEAKTLDRFLASPKSARDPAHRSIAREHERQLAVTQTDVCGCGRQLGSQRGSDHSTGLIRRNAKQEQSGRPDPWNAPKQSQPSERQQATLQLS